MTPRPQPHRPRPVGRRLLRATVVLTAWLLLAAPAQAEKVGSIVVPDSMPSMLDEGPSQPLLDPLPLNGSWAQPDHHPLGINLDNYTLTREQIEAAESTGCKLVRLPIPMERFLDEANPDWAVLDQVMSRLLRAGFEVLPVLTAQAAVPEFYTGFCRSVAQRYGPSLRYYQLLDNINYAIGLQSQDYADLASRARAAIILADPDAVIVGGGIRGADMTYLDMLANQRALDSLDVLAFNLMPPQGGVEDASAGVRREHCLPYMEDVVQWASERGKAVWVTSLGVSTCYNWVGVDQAEQASMYARGALYLGWMGVERVIFSAIQDSDDSFQNPARNCGLLDVYGVPKASYYALRALNGVVDGAYHIEPPFLYQGYVYEQPDAGDLLIAQELIGQPDADALNEFRVYGLQVFAFWFYAPEQQEYRVVYWLGGKRRNRMLLTLHVGTTELSPLDRFLLLDNAPTPVAYQFAQNFLYIPYQPLDEIPSVMRFEVKQHGPTS
jgi:hypothetical protein